MDPLKDESNDSSIASMTEATLDALYNESINIQKKIITENSDNVIRKLRQYTKLEDIKNNVIDANILKLESRWYTIMSWKIHYFNKHLYFASIHIYLLFILSCYIN